MVYRYFTFFILIIAATGCGRFDSQYTSVINDDEVSTFSVSCYNILGVPSLCIVTEATTKTIRIEHVVTKIVERVVKKEVLTQVPIEKIVTRVEKQYVETDRNVDIEKLVEFILIRIKEYVKPEDIIDIPTEDIVDETTDYITNPPPPNEDKDSTTMGDVRDDELIPIPPVDDKKDTTDPNSENNGTNEGKNDGGNNPGGNTGTDPDDTNNGGNTGTDPDDGLNNEGNNEGNTGTDDDKNPVPPVDDKKDTTDPNSENNGTNEGKNDGGNNPGGNTGTDPDDTNNGGNNGGNTGTEPDDGLNNGGNTGTEPDDTNNGGNTGTDPDDTNNGGNNGGNNGTEPDDGLNNGGNTGTDPDDKNNGGNNGTEPDDGLNNGGNTGTDPDDTNNGGNTGTEPDDGLNNEGNMGTEPDDKNNGGNTGTEPDDGLNNEGNTGTEPDGGSNDLIGRGDLNSWTPPEGIATIKLRVVIGPKKMQFQPHLNQPGVSIDISCDIDGTTVHPSLDSISVFRGDKRNLWGVKVWCVVPRDLDDSATTIHADVSDFKRWCGLTSADVVVVKFRQNDDGSSNSIGGMDALIDLSPNPVPFCNIAPTFTDGDSTTRYVLEETPSNTAIGLPVSATDEDDDTLVYSLGGTDADSFGIDSESGQLRTSAPLDYETRISYSVVVSVSDNKDGTDQITVSINVTNANEAPMFVEDSPTNRSVVENTVSGVTIGSPLSATDPDNDTLQYGLSGNEASSFSIDSTNGQLKTNAQLDYEIKDAYTVMVIADDNKGGTAEITVSISVTNANDAPVFTEGTTTNRSVAENLSSGAVVGNPVLATDQDEDTLEYSLGGTDADTFSIDSSSGQIKTSEPHDHETDDSYSVMVSVTDNNGGTDEITVSISVTNANDAPVFTENSPTTRSVAENLSSGATVGDPVLATDQDDTLEYSISGTGADSFSINSSSGQISTSKKLNHEDQDTYSVTVTADDNNGGTTDITVNISVSDENDKPVFTEGFFVGRSVAENLAVGALIGNPVLATDEDGDTLEYSIASSNTDIFGVDSSSAQLSTKVILNHEEQSSYSVTLSVTDNNGGTNGTFVTVSVTDANDAPVFTEGNTALRALIESASSGTNVGHAVSATDEDDDTLSYSISGTDASSFSLNTSTGRLSTNTTLDYDTQSSYSVTVSVTDNNGGSDEISVEIDVLEFYVEKQEFLEVYYALKLGGNHLTVQCYTIRGYGYDGENPIYVDNYYKFEDGSSEQTSTGWGSLLEENAISDYLDEWKADYSEENGFTHGYIKASVHGSTAEAAAKMLYQAICNAAKALGTWSATTRGITFPDIDNNTSDNILDLETLFSYLEDDDCDPNN